MYIANFKGAAIGTQANNEKYTMIKQTALSSEVSGNYLNRMCAIFIHL